MIQATEMGRENMLVICCLQKTYLKGCRITHDPSGLLHFPDTPCMLLGSVVNDPEWAMKGSISHTSLLSSQAVQGTVVNPDSWKLGDLPASQVHLPSRYFWKTF